MIYKIENDFLAVDINDLGAELYSIKSKKTGTEYLWQGDTTFWKSRATNLFPVCGRLFGGVYTYKGKEYQMPIHGFAKLFEFTASCISKEEICFTLSSNSQTKEYYPFDFILKISYALKDNCLISQFIVENLGKEMYFSCGGHPGFNVHFNKN